MVSIIPMLTMALFSLLVPKSDLCCCNLLAKLSLSPIYCKLHDKFCLPKRFMTALKQLKSNKELVVTKADKGNKVIIMNANDYKTKLNILLSDNDTYEPCVRDPLKSWQQNYNRSLKSIFADLSNLNKKKFNHIFRLFRICMVCRNYIRMTYLLDRS